MRQPVTPFNTLGHQRIHTYLSGRVNNGRGVDQNTYVHDLSLHILEERHVPALLIAPRNGLSHLSLLRRIAWDVLTRQFPGHLNQP